MMARSKPLVRSGRVVVCLATLLCLAGTPTEALAAVYALAGDSTIAPNDGNDGWGDALASFLPRGDTVVNRGANGRSTRTFINEGRWRDVLALEPDYVLIQFGHNDQKVGEPNLRTYPVDDPPGVVGLPLSDASNLFRVNLRRMVDDAREIDAVPVLITPVARRTTPYDNLQSQINWNQTRLGADGLGNSYSLLEYAVATKAVAMEKNVPLVDLNQLSLDLFGDMIARGESLATLGPPGDNTHFSLTGMFPIAELVARALPPLGVPEPGAGFLCACCAAAATTVGRRQSR